MDSGNNHSTWHTLSASCPLLDRVAEYGVGVFSPHAPQPTAYPLNLLMYGDSIDRCVHEHASSMTQHFWSILSRTPDHGAPAHVAGTC